MVDLSCLDRGRIVGFLMVPHSGYKTRNRDQKGECRRRDEKPEDWLLEGWGSSSSKLKGVRNDIKLRWKYRANMLEGRKRNKARKRNNTCRVWISFNKPLCQRYKRITGQNTADSKHTADSKASCQWFTENHRQEKH